MRSRALFHGSFDRILTASAEAMNERRIAPANDREVLGTAHYAAVKADERQPLRPAPGLPAPHQDGRFAPSPERAVVIAVHLRQQQGSCAIAPFAIAC